MLACRRLNYEFGHYGIADKKAFASESEGFFRKAECTVGYTSLSSMEKVCAVLDG